MKVVGRQGGGEAERVLKIALRKRAGEAGQNFQKQVFVFYPCDVAFCRVPVARRPPAAASPSQNRSSATRRRLRSLSCKRSLSRSSSDHVEVTFAATGCVRRIAAETARSSTAPSFRASGAPPQRATPKPATLPT